jgi:hypothetical protein
MTMIPIPDHIYAQLNEKAQALGLTVEQYVLPILQQAGPESPYSEPSPEERRLARKEWDAMIRSRADRYPPGFRVDDSRETIYFGSEDAPE